MLPFPRTAVLKGDVSTETKNALFNFDSFLLAMGVLA
jgi:hypothetical protein